MGNSNSGPGEDLANILLVLLKFLLVITVGLIDVVKNQLGLDAGFSYKVVNATPTTQVSSNGEFKVSLFPLMLKPHWKSDLVNTQIQVLIRSKGEDSNCSETFSSNITSNEEWIDPEEQKPTDADEESPRSDENGKAETGKRSSFRSETFMLPKIQRSSTKEYCFKYRVVFDNGGDRSSVRVPGSFEVEYEPPRSDLHWELSHMTVVQGRWVSRPDELRGVPLRKQTGGVELEGQEIRFVRVSDTLTPRLFDFEIDERIAEIGHNDFTLRLTGSEKLVQLPEDVIYLRSENDSESFDEVGFSDLKKGDAVWIEPGRKATVRAAPGRLVARLPVTVRRNLPPRSIYKELGREKADRVELLFPKDVFHDSDGWFENEGGLTARYFLLHRYIIDPDGVDNNGMPHIEIPFKKFSWPDGKKPTGFRLASGPEGSSAVLIVERPWGFEGAQIELEVEDDFGSAIITLQIVTMSRDNWGKLGSDLRY